MKIPPPRSKPQPTLKRAAEKKDEFWSRTLRTVQWRCTEWNEGREGIELYDHETDPQEYTHSASDPTHADTLQELRARLAAKLPPNLKR